MTQVDKTSAGPEATAQHHDLPLSEDAQKLMDLTKSILNPNGDNPHVDEYITASFQYILGAFYKMTTSSDKEATAREIAADLNAKFDHWVSEREKQKKELDDKKFEDVKDQ